MSTDGDMHMQNTPEPCIWLRYETQYSRDGLTHTVEMNVPVPIGASSEVRAQLFEEAEEGLRQLIQHMEHRSPLVAARSQSVSRPTSSLAAQRPMVRSAAVGAPQTSPHPSATVGAALVSDEKPVTRNGISGGMPPALAPATDGMGSLQLPQFIQYIKENMNLTPKQAMEMLNVRSLTTGVNLRDALERLRNLQGQDSVSLQIRRQEQDVSFAGMSGPQRSDPSVHLALAFDEEVEPDEAEPVADFPVDDNPPFVDMNRSPARMEEARAKVRELRESQGVAIVSVQRLQALNNTAVSQVSEEEILELAQGVWGVTGLKKLKVDQAEALISWAKHDDYFAEQVDAVLAVLEEEHYARGNR